MRHSWGLKTGEEQMVELVHWWNHWAEEKWDILYDPMDIFAPSDQFSAKLSQHKFCTTTDEYLRAPLVESDSLI